MKHYDIDSTGRPWETKNGLWVSSQDVEQLEKENERLRGNLSLAEEGLANYQQENAQLREALLRLSVSAQRLSEEAALALARK